MYVWFDALTDFVGVIGYPDDKKRFAKWWPGFQICGPDNLRFQTILWQGMLASAGLPFSQKVLVHGTILGEDGKKMSKSIGNVISPFKQVEKYNAEIVRYYLLAGLSTYLDTSYKEDDLKALYNANLANNYGNLLNRVIHLAKKKDVELLQTENVEKGFADKLNTLKKQVEEQFEAFDLYTACQIINEIATFGNKYIDDNKPWEKDQKESGVILNNLSILLDTINHLYEPIVPEASKKAQEALQKRETIILFQKIEA
jgi:methionyl-tRNA synthetase